MKLNLLALLTLTSLTSNSNNNNHIHAFVVVPRRQISSTTPANTGASLRHTTTQLHMFEQLAGAITDVTKNFTASKLTEENIKPATKDIRRALLDADVNINVVDTLIEGVKRRSLGQIQIEGVTAEQQFTKNIYDELLDLLGGNSADSKGLQSGNMKPASTLFKSTTENKPAVVLLAGLQGAGKTTAAGKLASYLKEREVDYDAVSAEEMETTLTSRMPKTNRKVLLVAGDIYRPAAISQLQILGEKAGVDVFTMGQNVSPVEIAQQAVKKAKEENYDTVLIDTAGRQLVDEDLMQELRDIQKAVTPDETLLVLDSMTGQEAANLAATFDSAVGITGAILSKMDGDSRGGAAVSVRGVSGKPIKFIGVGEKLPDLEAFYPDRMASRILGMGDVVSLVEKAAAEVSDADAARMAQKMKDATFDFDDFLKQAKLVSKMGSFAGVAKMLPGIGNNIDPKRMRDAELRLVKQQAMINAMTPEERANPDMLIKDRDARTRLQRITTDASLPFEDGLEFMSEFQRMRTMMARMQKNMPSGATGNDPEEMTADDMGMLAGNRMQRRMMKKKKKGGAKASKGFGS